MKEWSEHHHIGEQWRLFLHVIVLASLLAVLMTALSGAFNKAHGDHYESELTTEELAELVRNVAGAVDQGREIPAATLIRLQEKSRLIGVTDNALIYFLDILSHRKISPENLDYELHQMAHRHLILLRTLRDNLAEDFEIKALQTKAAQAVEQGDYKHAELFLIEAEEVAADKPVMVLAEILSRKGELLYGQYDYAAAAAAAAVPQEEEEMLILLTTKAGHAYFDAGLYPQAERYLKQAIILGEHTRLAAWPDLGTTLSNLAWVYENSKRFKEAELLYERALAILTKTLGEDHSLTQAAKGSLEDLRNRTITW